MEIAKTILEQLGGTRRLHLMIAAKDYIAGEKQVTFKFGAGATNKSNCLRVTLDPSDTYTVEFISVRGYKVEIKDSLSDVYAEDLAHLFESKTGMYLRL